MAITSLCVLGRCRKVVTARARTVAASLDSQPGRQAN